MTCSNGLQVGVEPRLLQQGLILCTGALSTELTGGLTLLGAVVFTKCYKKFTEINRLLCLVLFSVAELHISGVFEGIFDSRMVSVFSTRFIINLA